MMDRKSGGRRSVESKSHNRRSVGGYGRLSPTPQHGATAAAASHDRVDMLLMEANEISQYLKKDYVRSSIRAFQFGQKKFRFDSILVAESIFLIRFDSPI